MQVQDFLSETFLNLFDSLFPTQQIDETKNLHAYSERLKHVITGDNINIEQKGKDIISVQNLTNLLFTTNNEDALLISGDDRRMCMFRCSSR